MTRNEARRRQFAADPAAREAQRAYQADWYQRRRAADPQWAKARAEHARDYRRRRKAKVTA